MNTLFPIMKDNSNYINMVERHSRQFDIFLDEEIGCPADYRELISILFNASEYDDVSIFINSVGGQLDTALAIIEGLKHTHAHVTAVLIGACHSAASMIMMYCHNIIVSESAYAMIHTASYGSSGNTSNVKAHTEFTSKQIDKLLEDTYEGFLSKEEMGNIKKGVELWLHAEDIQQRLEKRAKVMKKRAKNKDITCGTTTHYTVANE
jgi:ATP-dependent protease ClpP protease subunit